MSTPRNETERSLRRHLVAIGLTAVALVFGIGALGATTRLAGAVVATGSLVVKSSVKKVQHQSGGIVGALLVEEGSHVQVGEVLIELDDTVARATVSALTNALYELQAQRGRLEAERDEATSITFPTNLTAASGQPEVARITDGETRLFAFRRNARTGQKNQLHQRVEQLGNEIEGLKEQSIAKDKELAIVSQELVGVQDLFDRNLIQLTRLDALQRDAARIDGERGQLIAQTAQTKGKIAETELQIIQIDEDMRSDVSRQLSEVHAKMSEVAERTVTAVDQLRHLTIRAPQDGVVHELVVHATGAVISPGEAIMLIVPDADKLVAEVRVSPQDIDQVGLDQEAMLRFPSFDQRTTPEFNARVIRVAADTTQDARTGSPFYSVQLSLQGARALAGVRLRPGMPVDALIKTSERTMMSYLLKPLADQASRAFREK